MSKQQRYLALTGLALCLIAVALIHTVSSSGANHPQAASQEKVSASWPRLTISPRVGVCSRDDAGDFYTDRQGSDSKLVPAGAIAVTVCSYNGGNPFGGAPIAALRAQGSSSDQTAVAHDIAALNNLPSPNPGPTSCGADDGSAAVATFHYASGLNAVIMIKLDGCEVVTNGIRTRATGDASDWLEGLTHPVKLNWATFTTTCTPSCEGADSVEAFHDHVLLGANFNPYRGRFRVLVSQPGRYTLALIDINGKVLARATASARIGHTTAVRFKLGLVGSRARGTAKEAPASAAAKLSASSPQLTISPRYGDCSRDDAGNYYTERTGSRKQLVPTGAVAVTVCSYNGMNPFGSAPLWALRARGSSSDQAAVARDISALNKLPKLFRGPVNCPMDDGTAMIATFHYRSGTDAVIMIKLNGCGGVMNGILSRDSGGEATGWLAGLAHPVKLRWATFTTTCTPSCEGADRVIASQEDATLGADYNPHHGHFRVLVSLPGRYTLTLYRVGTVLARVTANVTIGHTTAIRFKLK